MSHRNTMRAVHRVKDRLREGAALMRMHSPTGMKWYLLPLKAGTAPGREVPDEIAAKVIREPGIFPARDGMWPGCDQLYKAGEQP